MILAYLQVFGLAFACSALFVGRLARASLKKGLLLRQGIPLVGGIGLALAFMSAAAFKNLSFRWLTGGSAGIILPALVMLAFGRSTQDDREQMCIPGQIAHCQLGDTLANQRLPRDGRGERRDDQP